MLRPLSVFFCILFSVPGKAQCPQFYNYLGPLSSDPLFINCSGGSYAVNIQSNTGFGTYTISWGDGSPNTCAATYSANSEIVPTYAANTATYEIGSVGTLTEGRATFVKAGDIYDAII